VLEDVELHWRGCYARFRDRIVAVLKRRPLMERPVERDMRELVISRGRTGYVAPYSLDAIHDAVPILAVRHQRKAGYWSPDE